MAAIVLEDVRKSYGETLALAGLSLTVREGEILGLLGPNGAGKTTLISILAGTLRDFTGSVSFQGRDLFSDRSLKNRLGVVPQDMAFYEELNAMDNLLFWGGLYDVTRADLKRRAGELLELVELAGRAKEPVKNFSGGMKRRLYTAIGLLHKPDLLLLDEPTVGVDPQSRNLLLENVAALRARGRTIVYATHYMEEAERLCDRVAIVDHGRLLALGTVPALLAEHGGPPCLVVETGGCERRIETADPLADLQAIARAGRVDSFLVERARLEDVFLHLTGRRLRD
jgi:ABC-2 type transport system ATP-binding protein